MFGGVPTIAMQILDHRDFAKFDTSSVKSALYGGAPAPPNWCDESNGLLGANWQRVRTH